MCTLGKQVEQLSINDSSSEDKKLQEMLDRQDIGVEEKHDAWPVYNRTLEIRTKIMGRGVNTRTSIVNMFDLARTLGRPPIYLARYILSGVKDINRLYSEDTEEFQICGAHSAAKLAGVIDEFIKKFVECYKCGSAETEVVIIKKSPPSVNLICGGCGFNSVVASGEKLANRILTDHALPKDRRRGTEPVRRDFKLI